MCVHLLMLLLVAMLLLVGMLLLLVAHASYIPPVPLGTVTTPAQVATATVNQHATTACCAVGTAVVPASIRPHPASVTPVLVILPAVVDAMATRLLVPVVQGSHSP